MKKFFSILLLLCLTSLMMLGAVACDKKSPETNEETRQEQILSSDADDEKCEKPERPPHIHRRHKRRVHKDGRPHWREAREKKTSAPKTERLPKCRGNECPQKDNCVTNL